MHPVAAYYTAFVVNMLRSKKGKPITAQDLMPTERKKRPKLELDPLMTADEFSAAVRERARQVQDEWIEKRLAEDH